MMSPESPDHVAIIGAGMAGLATAWHLQERGVEVTLVDRKGVGAGASWGNAGFLTPAFTWPLPEPSTLRAGLKGILVPSSPIAISPRLTPSMLKFLIGVALNSTNSRWNSAMQAFNAVNGLLLEAYDQLSDSVTVPTKPAEPYLAAFSSSDARQGLEEEFEKAIATGSRIDYSRMDGDEARSMEPILSENVHSAIRVDRQRYIDPPAFIHGLAEAVRDRGGTIIEGVDVTEVVDLGSHGVELRPASAPSIRADQAVLANGAWLSDLAGRFGVRLPVIAGHGYSFSVLPEQMPSRPIYLAGERSACNPLTGRFRITGGMRLGPPDAPLHSRRIQELADSVTHMFNGIDWSQRDEEWIGGRPCTPDGLPLVGVTESPRVHIMGGLGMWGIVMGPLTGRLLAEQMTGNGNRALLEPFDPLR